MSEQIIISMHQPNFIPYLGFFDKMKSSDIFVIRDEVLYVKKEFHNRNKIRIIGNSIEELNSKWISVPVINPHDYILHAKINNEQNWKESFLRTIKENYSKAKFFNDFYPEFKEIILEDYEKLVDLNIKIINYFMKHFKIDTKIILASELNLKGKNYEKSDASEDLAKISKKYDADIYLSGSGGKDYLDLEPFEKLGIKVEFQEYNHPEYEQAFPGFIPYMSAIDTLFCIGGFPNEGQ